MRKFFILAGAALGIMSASAQAQDGQKILERMLQAPRLEAAEGFKASLLVGTGHLFDPRSLRAHGNEVWTNDDGGEEGEAGGSVAAISQNGKIGAIIGLGKMLPPLSFDIAPKSFGNFGGQVFALTQPTVGTSGGRAGVMVHRYDPKDSYTQKVVCTLPEAGLNKSKVAGAGGDAVFGPDGTPFAGRLFTIAIINDVLYQTTIDGKCRPFVQFDSAKYTSIFSMTFTPDGSTMLVSALRGPFDPFSTERPKGVIVKVSPSGEIIGELAAEGLERPTMMIFAPQGFGNYEGELFVADAGRWQIPVPPGQPLDADGKLFRITNGKAEPVLTGLINPQGVLFLGKKLLVADINGDFIGGPNGGAREIPDGFVAAVEPR